LALVVVLVQVDQILFLHQLHQMVEEQEKSLLEDPLVALVAVEKVAMFLVERQVVQEILHQRLRHKEIMVVAAVVDLVMPPLQVLLVVALAVVVVQVLWD
jgi:hypothetical protein